MKRIFLLTGWLLVTLFSFSQNVGIGTVSPLSTLHIKTTTINPLIIDGGSNVYSSILENGVYRGYWGSYAGNPEDVDFGTGAGNTTGKVHLTIQAVPKLTMDNVGNIGIGTTTPNYKLHVNTGDIFLQSSAGRLMIGYDGGNQWRYSTTNGGADLLMYSFNGAADAYKHYFSQNGFVGLGTGSNVPSAPLHVKTTNSEVVRIEGAHPYTSLYDNTDGYRAYWWYNGSDIIFGSASGAGVPIKLAPNGSISTVFMGDGTGRVWIGSGTINPATGYLLSVKGKVICEEAKVQLNASWPDYVFKNDYHLMPIDELEKNINANQHLPNIPAASDMEKNGILLGDMNRRIIEKVEELTLYIIDLHKQNEKLQLEVNQLKKDCKKN